MVVNNIVDCHFLPLGLSQNRPTSTKKDKRPLSLLRTQPSKRLREELTDPDPYEGKNVKLEY